MYGGVVDAITVVVAVNPVLEKGGGFPRVLKLITSTMLNCL